LQLGPQKEKKTHKRDLTGRFRQLWSPAARVERRGSFRAPSAIFWWGQVEEEAAGGGSSTASSGGRSTGSAARVLRWVLGKEERSASCARMRRS